MMYDRLVSIYFPFFRYYDQVFKRLKQINYIMYIQLKNYIIVLFITDLFFK